VSGNLERQGERQIDSAEAGTPFLMQASRSFAQQRKKSFE
jgi:hypothetical protein